MHDPMKPVAERRRGSGVFSAERQRGGLQALIASSD
jgi:hypothetical protein